MNDKSVDPAIGLAEHWKDCEHSAPADVTAALAKAVLRLAALAAQREPSASQPDTVAVPREQLEHWAEYWNGSANEKAMSDALEHILGEVDDLLRAAQEAK